MKFNVLVWVFFLFWFFLPQVKILNYIEMALLQIEDNELSKCTKRKDKKNAVVKENVLGEDG